MSARVLALTPSWQIASEVLITTIVVQLNSAHSGNQKPFYLVMCLRLDKRILMPSRKELS